MANLKDQTTETLLFNLGFRKLNNLDKNNAWYEHPNFAGYLTIPINQKFDTVMDFISYIFELGKARGYEAAKAKIASNLTNFIVDMDKE